MNTPGHRSSPTTRLTAPARVAAPPYATQNRSMTGHVYFIQADTGGPVKIGWAKDPEKRRRDLQTGSAHTLVLRATITGTLADEARLHRRFAAHRLSGEWFTPTPELEQVAGCPLPAGAHIASQTGPHPIKALVCDTCHQREATIIDLRPWARWNCDVHLLCDHEDCPTVGYWTTIERFLGNEFPTRGGMRKHIEDTKGHGIVEAIDERLKHKTTLVLKYVPE